MTTLEKLFLHIFHRNHMIIEEMQQLADSYTQQLASRCLIDGITPPAWLFSPNSNHHSSNPNELEREKIISKLILGPPRAPTRYSTHGCSLYCQPVDARGNQCLSNVMCMRNHASNEALNVSNEPMETCDGNEKGRSLNRVPELNVSVKSTLNEATHGGKELACSLNHVSVLDDNVKYPPKEVGARISNIYAAPDTSLECHNNDIGRSLNRVAELNAAVESSQNKTIARITSTYAAPDMSLSRIQRSKSRQKARELRSNVKTTAKSCLRNENRACISYSGDSKSKKDFHQIVQDKQPSEVDKCNDISQSAFMTSEEKGDKANDGTSHSGSLANSSSPCGKPSLENDLTKKGRQASSGKENLDVGNMMQPVSDSLEQYGLVNGVMEGISIPDCCLGSYASKKSRSGKTQGTQSHNKPFCGRITRSRSSSRQITGINKSSDVVTSVSCNPIPKEGRGVLSHSIGDFQHKLDATSKLLAAAETSKVLRDRIQETRAICSSGGVLKPVSSSNTNMKESSPGANHQENTEIVVGNGPVDLPVVMHCVNSGIKVNPKHLNFDEINECEISEICSPLSKKRKLDGLGGQKCSPSKESASSIDHKFSSSFLEQQLSKANALSSSPEAARTDSYNNIQNLVVEDVELNYNVSQHDKTDVTCEVNIYPKEVDHILDEETHLGKSHLNKDSTSSLHMEMKEGDLGHKGEEGASGVSIHITQNSKPSFISSLTKQGNNDFLVDLGSSKSENFEVGSNSKLSSMKLTSANFSICPLNQQKKAEYQPNCFSDSGKDRMHIQSDAIHLNLKPPETDSNSIKSFHNEMICDLPEGIKPLHMLQAAEATEVDDGAAETTHSVKQSEPTSVLNIIKNAADVGPANPIVNDGMVTDNNKFGINLPEWVSSYESAEPSQNGDKTVFLSESSYECFIIDEEIENLNAKNNEVERDFDMIARAIIIEQLCKSASMNGLMADGILDHTDIRSTISLDSRKHLQTSGSCLTESDSVFQQHQQVNYASPFYWQSKNHYLSPTGKPWERSASSSGKGLSSNPDLTCLPIEEDPISNEEGENAEEGSNEVQDNIISKVENHEMKTERTENDYKVAVEIQEPPHESTKYMKHPDRCSSNSVNIDVSVPRTRDNVKRTPKLHHVFKVSTYKENHNSSIVTPASSRGNLSKVSKSKSTMRSGTVRLSQKEAKRNNVSTITSFTPMLQQKQAVAVCTGKRDIKVKALEALEAAKLREQNKENERKLKKEALKLEWARIEKEIGRKRELDLIKKQEELKKKEADAAERKRLREEEEERKQAAKKRKLGAEAQKNQKPTFEKTQAQKVEIQKHVKNAAVAGNKKKIENLRLHKNADESSVKKPDTKLRIDKTLAYVKQQVTSVLENHDASYGCGAQEKVTKANEKTPIKVAPLKLTSQEKSYEISPYQSSDNEDDADDNMPSKSLSLHGPVKTGWPCFTPCNSNLTLNQSSQYIAFAVWMKFSCLDGYTASRLPMLITYSAGNQRFRTASYWLG